MDLRRCRAAAAGQQEEIKPMKSLVRSNRGESVENSFLVQLTESHVTCDANLQAPFVRSREGMIVVVVHH